MKGTLNSSSEASLYKKQLNNSNTIPLTLQFKCTWRLGVLQNLKLRLLCFVAHLWQETIKNLYVLDNKQPLKNHNFIEKSIPNFVLFYFLLQ